MSSTDGSSCARYQVIADRLAAPALSPARYGQLTDTGPRQLAGRTLDQHIRIADDARFVEPRSLRSP